MSMNSQMFTTKPFVKVRDEDLIGLLYKRVMKGWNKGIGQAFAKPFSADADLVGFDGTYLKGRAQIAAFHQKLFDTYVKGSRLVGKIRSVRFLSPNISIVHAVGGTVMAGQSDIDPERNSIQTIVATKSNDKWFIAAFQNTRVQYIGRPELCEALTDELRKEI
jgi:uncharacterized protein (TIGR02246 family)